MATKSKKSYQSVGKFSLGTVSAETDTLLDQAFWTNVYYGTMQLATDHRAFVVGRTGAGKSAAFRELKSKFGSHVITLNPEDLAFDYLTNVSALRVLSDLDVHYEPVIRFLWKHVIVTELLNHRYKHLSQPQRPTVINNLKAIFDRSPGRQAAERYLTDFGSSFWCPTDERIHKVVDKLSDEVTRAAGGDLGANVGFARGSINASRTSKTASSREEQVESRDRFQEVVNEFQATSLNRVINLLNNHILESNQHFTYLLIDDLDRDWIDDRFRMQVIRCLIDAVIDFSNVDNLKIMVAMRTNIFHQLGTKAQKYDRQTEKIRDQVLRIVWDRDELVHLMEQRVKAASTYYQLSPPMTLGDLMPADSKTQGSAIDFILARTLLRPRDVISYFNVVLDGLSRPRKLSWDDLRSAEREYSIQRLEALRDEWKDPYEGIQLLFEGFRSQPSRLDRGELDAIYEHVLSRAIDEKDSMGSWAWRMMDHYEETTELPDWARDELSMLLFETNFLGVRSAKSKKARYYAYDVETGQADIPNMADGLQFSVHPAFQEALSIKPEWLKLES